MMVICIHPLHPHRVHAILLAIASLRIQLKPHASCGVCGGHELHRVQ